ncbi:MAG: ABC transporter permease [Lachnospiraceae bacterium]|nr:ABC transporter permease [Lachnospiraceae bacterium]
MLDSLQIMMRDVSLAIGQTFYMVIISLIIATILGGALGLLMFLTADELFVKLPVLNSIMSSVINVIRSVPFLILMIFLLPLSKIIVGTKIGPTAVIVPLSIATIAFFARLAEASFSEVNHGVLEAYVASGALKRDVIFKILLPEAWPSLVKNITVTSISVLGFSAMAGLVGGGGLGDLAYRYGYQQYKTNVMIVCVILLIALVQIIQYIGDTIVLRINQKKR